MATYWCFYILYYLGSSFFSAIAPKEREATPDPNTLVVWLVVSEVEEEPHTFDGDSVELVLAPNAELCPKALVCPNETDPNVGVVLVVDPKAGTVVDEEEEPKLKLDGAKLKPDDADVEGVSAVGPPKVKAGCEKEKEEGATFDWAEGLVCKN
jgi:hypothetical protein